MTTELTAVPAPEVRHTRLFVGGEWAASQDGFALAVEDPSSGTAVAEVASANVRDADAALDAAGAAQQAWANTAPRQRAEILRRAFELMRQRREQLARLIVLESGKALREARSEVDYAADFFRWYSEEAAHIHGTIGPAPSGANQMLATRCPVGVAVLVTPWNFPAAMLTRKIGPAFAAGCSVIVKPAPETPLTALELAALLTEAGAPPGTVNVLPTVDADAVVGHLLADARTRKLSFTGSTAVGRHLLARAAPRVLHCSMELGGNAPFVVLADAHIDAAVADAMIAKLRNGGQSCTAANRFLVDARVADDFAETLATAMRGVRVGPGLDEACDLGPVITRAAKDRIEALISQGQQDGAALLAGGHAQPATGYFVSPTVLHRVPPHSRLFQEEVFGPVAAITTFDSEDEAVELANATEHGLVAFVHSSDLGRALHLADQLETGMVGINRGVVSDPAAPFGGWKQSGLGREGGHEGVQEYLETKYVAVSW